jgi:hypothetical protein
MVWLGSGPEVAGGCGLTNRGLIKKKNQEGKENRQN